jgi:chemotaxis receptor (MCP) glutamine deamidase CheD
VAYGLGIGLYDPQVRVAGLLYAILAALDLNLAGQEVGGHIGRTVRLYPADGRMTVSSVGCKEKEL